MQEQRLNYIHENPVRAGFVYKAEDYVYSSACDYGGTKGLLDLLLLELYVGTSPKTCARGGLLRINYLAAKQPIFRSG